MFYLTLHQLVSSADSLGKKFGPRSGRMNHQAWSGYKFIDIRISLLKELFHKNNFLQKIGWQKIMNIYC